MDVRIGTAPDSWGVWFGSDPKQIPWDRFLDEAVMAGYDTIELGPYGYLPTDPDVLARELDWRGLQVSGTFLMKHLEDPDAWSAIEEELNGIGKCLNPLGAQYLVLIDDTYTDLFTGVGTRPPTLTDEQWRVLIATSERIAQLARERFGLTTVFHPHAETHVEYESQIERFLADTDPASISLCLDTGHHAYRGGDPVAFMRKHHARIRYLHLKSVDASMRDEVARKGIPFAAAVAMGMFCEPAKGAVDFRKFRDVLRKVKWQGLATVEQDTYPADFDSLLPIAKRTFTYLRDLGFGPQRRRATV